MKKYTAALAVMALTAASGASAQGILGQISGFLDKVAPKTAVAPTLRAPQAIVEPSPNQLAAVQRIVANQNLSPELQATVAEAAPLIERVALTSACAINNTAWYSLNRIREKPSEFYTTDLHIARRGDQYHEKSQCHDVMRIVEFTKPAANALKFKVMYISPSSNGASTQEFTLIKSMSEGWMIRDIGYAYT